MTALPLLALLLVPAADPPNGLSAREALKPFNLFVGKWKGTGVPDGPGGAKAKEFWTETVEWTWGFKADDAWLVAAFDKNPTYKSAELRYDREKKQYTLSLVPAEGKPILYRGELKPGTGKEQILALERTDEANAVERMVFTLLHDNRYLYRLEAKPAGAASFARKYQVGVTKEGSNFATATSSPECIVSGGKGTSRVTHKGQTYYVCCSGCRDAFKDDPEKFIKEFEAKKLAEKKETKK
jgi:YHS domain-containing protein